MGEELTQVAVPGVRGVRRVRSRAEPLAVHQLRERTFWPVLFGRAQGQLRGRPAGIQHALAVQVVRAVQQGFQPERGSGRGKRGRASRRVDPLRSARRGGGAGSGRRGNFRPDHGQRPAADPGAGRPRPCLGGERRPPRHGAAAAWAGRQTAAARGAARAARRAGRSRSRGCCLRRCRWRGADGGRSRCRRHGRRTGRRDAARPVHRQRGRQH